MKRALVIVLLILITCISGCSNSALSKAEDSLQIVTSFYPIYVLTKNVVSNIENVRLVNLTEPQTGCLHDYELTPGDMKTLLTADVLVVNGAGMETFMESVAGAYPELKVVEASQGIPLIGDNPHVWVSISGAIQEVKNIANQLAAIDPENKQAYKNNSKAYIKKLEALKEKMQASLRDVKTRKIITFHEAFPYFAKEFDLEVVTIIEREPGTEPSAGELKETIGIINGSGANALFAEPQYSTKAAEGIAAETGIKIYSLDPLVTGPKDAPADSYIKTMEKNLETLIAALK